MLTIDACTQAVKRHIPLLNCGFDLPSIWLLAAGLRHGRVTSLARHFPPARRRGEPSQHAHASAPGMLAPHPRLPATRCSACTVGRPPRTAPTRPPPLQQRARFQAPRAAREHRRRTQAPTRAHARPAAGRAAARAPRGLFAHFPRAQHAFLLTAVARTCARLSRSRARAVHCRPAPNFWKYRLSLNRGGAPLKFRERHFVWFSSDPLTNFTCFHEHALS